MSNQGREKFEGLKTTAGVTEKRSYGRGRTLWQIGSKVQASPAINKDLPPVKADSRSHFHVADFGAGHDHEDHLFILSFSRADETRRYFVADVAM